LHVDCCKNWINTVYKLSLGDIHMQTASPIVAVVRGERGHEPVFKALDLIDYRKALAGYDKVLIKVNFITTKTGTRAQPQTPL